MGSSVLDDRICSQGALCAAGTRELWALCSSGSADGAVVAKRVVELRKDFAKLSTLVEEQVSLRESPSLQNSRLGLDAEKLKQDIDLLKSTSNQVLIACITEAKGEDATETYEGCAMAMAEVMRTILAQQMTKEKAATYGKNVCSLAQSLCEDTHSPEAREGFRRELMDTAHALLLALRIRMLSGTRDMQDSFAEVTKTIANPLRTFTSEASGPGVCVRANEVFSKAMTDVFDALPAAEPKVEKEKKKEKKLSVVAEKAEDGAAGTPADTATAARGPAPGKDAAPATAGGKQAVEGATGLAKFEYTSDHSGDLEFPAAAVITDIRLTEDAAWLSGKYKGGKGIFPNGWVEMAGEPAPYEPSDDDENAAWGTHARALFPFQGEEGELVFEEGAEIFGVVETDDDNWYHGEMSNGAMGIFPVSYVKLLDEQKAGPAGSTRDKPGGSRVVNAVALFNFDGRDSQELIFDIGDVIANVRETDAEEWWTGEVGGRRGLFPAGYVELQGGASRPASKSSSDDDGGGGGGGAKKTAPTGMSTVKWVALYDFDGEGDELSFREGDELVWVQDTEIDEWQLGRLGDRTGLFPAGYVEQVEEAYEGEMGFLAQRMVDQLN